MIKFVNWLACHQRVVVFAGMALGVMTLGVLFAIFALQDHDRYPSPSTSKAGAPTIEVFDPSGGVRSDSAPLPEKRKATKALEKKVEPRETTETSDSTANTSVIVAPGAVTEPSQPTTSSP